MLLFIPNIFKHMVNFSENPASNTGYKSQTTYNDSFAFSFDWLQFTITLPYKIVRTFISDLVSYGYNDAVDFSQIVPRFLGRQYSQSVRSVNSAQFCWDLPEGAEPIKLLVSFPGSWCRCLSLGDFFRLFQSLPSVGHLSFTRVDLALDDFAPTFFPSDCFEASQLRNFSGFSAHSFIQSTSSQGVGSTFYAGSPSSDNRLRIYETLPLHGFYGLRLERQLRGDYAQIFMARFYSLYGSDGFSPSSLCDFCLPYILSSTQFLDRYIDDVYQKNLDRCVPLPFWSNFLSRVRSVGVQFSLARPVTSFPRKLKWLLESVSKSYYYFASVFDKSSLDVSVPSHDSGLDSSISSFTDFLFLTGSQLIKDSDFFPLALLNNLDFGVLLNQAAKNRSSWLPQITY